MSYDAHFEQRYDDYFDPGYDDRGSTPGMYGGPISGYDNVGQAYVDPSTGIAYDRMDDPVFRDQRAADAAYADYGGYSTDYPERMRLVVPEPDAEPVPDPSSEPLLTGMGNPWRRPNAIDYARWRSQDAANGRRMVLRMIDEGELTPDDPLAEKYLWENDFKPTVEPPGEYLAHQPVELAPLDEAGLGRLRRVLRQMFIG